MSLQKVSIGVLRENEKNSLFQNLKEDKTKPKLQTPTINEELLNILKMMSHDLRGSLLSILAILKLLDRGYYGNMEESVKIKLKEIFERVNVLIGMTEEYLSRAFSVNEDLEADHEVLDLRQDIINPILKEFSLELKERHIEIENRSDFNSKDQILLKGSRIWLKAVFRNLLMNAIHYGETGGVVTFDFKKEGSMYRVKIYNSGKPIPIEWRNKLFTKFSNNRDNNSEGYNGMGIGLLLVKMIIQKHGGDIWYEAKEHGSNFIMTIPALD